jgi:hypothetical protein
MRIITPKIENNFASVFARVSEAVDVPFVKVSGEWQPKQSCCHANADYWATLHPNVRTVRGWFLNGPNEMGGCLFIAHSVLDKDGNLFDITPPAPNPPMKFLRHKGSKEAFDAIQPEFSSADYPFILEMDNQPVEDEEIEDY